MAGLFGGRAAAVNGGSRVANSSTNSATKLSAVCQLTGTDSVSPDCIARDRASYRGS